MKKLTSILITSFAVVGGACTDDVQRDVVDAGVVVDGDAGEPVVPKLPETCAELRARENVTDDGDYWLFVGGDFNTPWNVWCADMATAPKEYVRLQKFGPRSNFSSYIVGGGATGYTVKTFYSNLRIDPKTLVVDTSDQRYSSSEGAITVNHGSVMSMPYGVAAACDADAVEGLANIDLRGTPFALADEFQFVGPVAWGNIAADASMKTIEISGGGQCGSNAPKAGAGGSLKLVYAL